MTFQDLITIMREDYLSDTFDGIDTATPREIDDNVMWKDRQLLRYLLESQEEACMRGDFIYTDELEIQPLAGERTYNLDPVMLRIDKVLYGDKVITHVSKETLANKFPDWRTRTGMEGEELYYYMTGFKFNVFPMPDTIDETSDKVLMFEGYRMPSENLLASDEVEIPLPMQRNLIWYALHNCYQLNDADALNYKESQIYFNKFDQAFGPKLDHRIIIHQLEEPQLESYLGPVNYKVGEVSTTDDEWHS